MKNSNIIQETHCITQQNHSTGTLGYKDVQFSCYYLNTDQYISRKICRMTGDHYFYMFEIRQLVKVVITKEDVLY